MPNTILSNAYPYLVNSIVSKLYQAKNSEESVKKQTMFYHKIRSKDFKMTIGDNAAVSNPTSPTTSTSPTPSLYAAHFVQFKWLT
jgi:hypothetical protein